jgi:23S rRNA (guanosine2251-2'-O)-methyltransferase
MPGGKPAGKAGRAGPASPAGRSSPPGAWSAGGRPSGGRPPNSRPPGRTPDRAIPDGPWHDQPGDRGAPDRGAPDRGAPDRGPWRPSRRDAGPAGSGRGSWRPPTPGGRPPDRRPPTRRTTGPPTGDQRRSHDPGEGPQRPARGYQRPGEGPPRPYQPGGRPGTRPPYRGGPPDDRPPWRPPFRPAEPPGRPWQRPGFERDPWPRPAAALPAPDLLGPDEELVAGRRPVEEVFAAGRTARRLLVVPQRRNALEQVVLHATRLRIPIVEVEGGSLTAIAGFDGHQGVALVVEPRRFASLDDILARAGERREPPFVLVLDSLEDPQNVGTLLRSAEAAGVHGIVFPTRRQAPLSPAAVKASAGAVEHLLLCPVDDLARALADLHSRGLRIAGSEAEATLTARQTDLRGPLAIVVGSEGQGLGPTVRKRCDLFMRIPMRGAIGSLNAAVAGSVLLFEAVAQRDPGGRPSAVPTANRATAAPVVEESTAVDADRTEPATRAAESGEPPAASAGAPEPAVAAEPSKPTTRAKVSKPAKPVRTPKTRSATSPADTPGPADPSAGIADPDLLPGGPAPAEARKPRTPRARHA